MSTTSQGESAESAQQQGSPGCQPLMDAATRNLYRNNAFRITGLAVDATAREESGHNDRIKHLSELGKNPQSPGAAYALRPPPGVDDIREAIQKLKDPQKRLMDEFFWFWPQEHGQSHADPALQALPRGETETAIEIWKSKDKSTAEGAVAAHNLALAYHITALDWENYAVKNQVAAERRQKITDGWKAAYEQWNRLVTDERLWERFATRIRHTTSST